MLNFFLNFPMKSIMTEKNLAIRGSSPFQCNLFGHQKRCWANISQSFVPGGTETNVPCTRKEGS